MVFPRIAAARCTSVIYSDLLIKQRDFRISRGRLAARIRRQSAISYLKPREA
jgi:hypothetical protein